MVQFRNSRLFIIVICIFLGVVGFGGIIWIFIKFKSKKVNKSQNIGNSVSVTNKKIKNENFLASETNNKSKNEKFLVFEKNNNIKVNISQNICNSVSETNKKGQNENSLVSEKNKKIKWENFLDLYQYFIPKGPNEGTLFCTFFKTRSPDGNSYFTSFRTNTSYDVFNCYDSLRNLQLSEYSHVIKTKYLQEEKDTVYTIKSQIKLEELDEDLFFTKEHNKTYTIHKFEYLRLLKFLKSKEEDIQKKSFFTFFVGTKEIAIFTFDHIFEFWTVYGSQKLQDMKYKEKFTQCAIDLLFFYILDNQVSVRNEELEPVMAQ